MSAKTRYPVRVQWADCDPASRVYYPNYFRMFDSATHHLMEQAGVPIPDVMRRYRLLGLPLVDVRASFKASCACGDRLEVESEIAEWRDRSFVVSHTVWRDGTVVAKGREIRVWGERHPDDPDRLVAGDIPAEFKASFNRDVAS